MISITTSAESGNGLYSFPEVARYLDVHPRTLRSWFLSRSKCGPLLSGQIESTKEDGAWLSFHDFLQAYAVNELKKEGVKPQHVREAIAQSKKEGLRYPMSMEGIEIFADKNGKVQIRRPGEKHPSEMTGAGKDQTGFMPIVKRYLHKVEFKDGVAAKFIFFEKDYNKSIHKRVVMTPCENFGEPTVEGTYYRAATLRDAVKAEGSVAEVARLYSVDESDVRVAIDAGKTRARKAA